jgi:hypothetical protein
MGVTVDGEDAGPSSRGGVGREWMDLAVSVAGLGSSPASGGVNRTGFPGGHLF